MMSESVFLLALVVAATTAVLAARAISAGMIGRRGDAGAELQERLDFTERVLAQICERPSLGPGEERG